MTATAPAPTVTVLRAYRFTLDPTPAQVAQLYRFAGNARWAFNHALAAKIAAHDNWRAQVDQLVEAGIDEPTARCQVKVPVPTKPVIQKAWNAAKGDNRTGVDGICDWWHEASTYCFQSGFADADTAWSNWLNSYAGRRAGRRVDAQRPTIRLAIYRRLLVPRLGELRVHGTAKPLAKRIARGTAVIQSVTISRGAHRWYASVLCKITTPVPVPSRAQQRAGTVGVDLGVRTLAALSTGELIPNPHHLDASTRRLVRAQRALARTRRDSKRHAAARARVARVHHEIAVRRASALHGLTKRLATGWAAIAIEDLNTAGMTASARGTLDKPGRMVAHKAGLNRGILDASFAEIRRQLGYKTTWYGSTLIVIDRWAPTSKTCSTCGWRNPILTLAERTFHCTQCGLVIDRDHNATINIATLVEGVRVASAHRGAGLGERMIADAIAYARARVPRHPVDDAQPPH